MTTRRKRIAENLLGSQQQTASLTTFNEIDMSAVTALASACASASRRSTACASRSCRSSSRRR
jgi:pyruvate/2-oxoglutarate dehydrogenase complex dihydrolipoamide acyltransferase (E2) component